MTKPLTIEQIEAAFAIAAERLLRPKQVHSIERLMFGEILLTFTDDHCLCIKDADIEAQVKEMKDD